MKQIDAAPGYVEDASCTGVRGRGSATLTELTDSGVKTRMTVQGELRKIFRLR